MRVTLRGYGLKVEGITYDIKDIRALLSERFNYWDDDIPHKPFLDI